MNNSSKKRNALLKYFIDNEYSHDALQKVILSILQGNSFCFEENIVDLTVVGL